ncbi:MAG: hypothetical protein M1833_004783 [Piccolia ochrophora]|nr:MAG: hypothetical protein M1833_004783 [Piccolia ochrophora]
MVADFLQSAAEIEEDIFDISNGYPVHQACWNILRKTYCSSVGHETVNVNLLGQVLASQDADNDEQFLTPDWSGDWGESAWFPDGWMDDNGAAGDIDDEDLDVFDYLARDPEDMTELEPLLLNPPETSTPPVAPVQITLEDGASQRQKLPRFPSELWIQILCLLPTKSVLSLRLASRLIAAIPLSQQWWLSRFEFPHELCHLPVPTEAINSVSPPVYIDWLAYVTRVLHPSGESFPCWTNRKRILRLNFFLTRRLSRMGNTLKVASPKHAPVTAESATCAKRYTIPNRQADWRSRLEFTSQLTVSSLRTIVVFFVEVSTVRVVSGISFSDDATVVELGHCEDGAAEKIDIRTDTEFEGLIIGVNRKGFCGVKVVVRDNNGATATLDSTAGTFDCWPWVAEGQLAAHTPSDLRGFEAHLATNNAIVSIGVLEANISLSTPPSPSIPWDPAPSPDVITSQLIGSAQPDSEDFSRYKCMLFADDESALNHLVRITGYLNVKTGVLQSLQFHFDNSDSVPLYPPGQSTVIDFVIHGPEGEVISGVDVVLWDNIRGVGINLLTNWGRRAYFTQSKDRPGIRAETLVVPQDKILRGFYGRFDPAMSPKIDAQEHSPYVLAHSYQNLGILCSEAQGIVSLYNSKCFENSQRFDDHGNIWTSESLPPSEYTFGEVMGTQPENGFINWIDLTMPLSQFRHCMGTISWNLTAGPADAHDLIGFEIQHACESGTHLVGIDQGRGSYFDVSQTCETLTVMVITELGPFDLSTPTEIQFLARGEPDGSWEEGRHWRLIKSTPGLKLVGLAWSYNGTMLQRAIQPLFEIQENDPRCSDLHQYLYPSLKWTSRLSTDIEIRPIPAEQSETSTLETAVGDKSKPRSQLSRIVIFFNSFLQGVELHYKDGQIRSAGNTVGATQTCHLQEGEQVSSVRIHDRVTDLTGNGGTGAIFCVDGLSFGLVTGQGLQQTKRWIPFSGASKFFGPYVKQQHGLCSHFGSSLDLDAMHARTLDLQLRPGTSLAGIYLESTPTYVRRAGVLISRDNGLPDSTGASPAPRKEPSSYVLDIDTKDSRSAPPWLGVSPSLSCHFVSDVIIGRCGGKYRAWCTIPPRIIKMTIYRQRRQQIVGIEFHSAPGRSNMVGFRSFQHDGTVVVGCDNHACQRSFGVRIQETKHGLDVIHPGPRDLPESMSENKWNEIRPWEVGHGSSGDGEEQGNGDAQSHLTIVRDSHEDTARVSVNPKAGSEVVVGVWVSLDTGIEGLGLVMSQDTDME